MGVGLLCVAWIWWYFSPSRIRPIPATVFPSPLVVFPLHAARHLSDATSTQPYQAMPNPRYDDRRRLYRKRGGDGATFDPVATRVGLVDGTTTLAAARVISRQVSSTSESESAALLAEQGTMCPSPAHVGRVMRGLGSCVESAAGDIEEAIRLAELCSETLPDRDVVATIAVSLDGIMVRMKDAPNTPGASKSSSVPNGHREAATATVSLYDVTGARLHTVKLGRMPQSKKVTLHRQLERELKAFIERYPTAKVVAVADAARENWRILNAIRVSLDLRYLTKIIDYFHARDHLLEALRLSGARTPAKEKWAKVLLEESDGVDQILQELVRRRSFRLLQASASRLKDFDKEITYFTNNRDMMHYAEHREKCLPIGSGVQEAACKTLVAERLKRSGMSWLLAGGQAVISFRGFIQSERFAFAWTELEKRLPDDTFETDTKHRSQKAKLVSGGMTPQSGSDIADGHPPSTTSAPSRLSARP